MTEARELLSIGDMSIITRLSVKALRFYDEKGLLVPSRKEITGYRWYSFEQIPRALLLRRLSDLEFGVQEMKEVLDELDSGANREALQALLARRLEKLDSQMRDLAAVKGQLERKDFFEVMDLKQEEPVVKTVPAVRVIARRGKGRYGEVIPRMISELCGVAFSQPQARVSGPIMALYYDDEYKEEDADVEVLIPITGRVTVPETMEIKNLEGAKVVSAMHRGAYQRIGETYARAYGYISDKGFKVNGHTREHYLSDPTSTSEEDLLTEVQVPVE